jgi:hypothetical protein
MAAEKKIVESVIQTLEKTVDNEINSLGDLEQVRQARLKAMKQRAKDEVEWKAHGHGEYSEIPDEPAFFDAINKSKNVVLHFYRDATMRCKIVDMHLKLLAPQFIGTKFIKINAEKSPFLTKRLKITVLPTIVGIIDKQIVDRIVGFTELGNTDDFTTQDMKIRLSVQGVIDYSGDSSPKSRRKMRIEMENARRSRNLRDSGSYDSDEDDDYPEPSCEESEPGVKPALLEDRTRDFDAALAELDLDG